jgi:outer membrane receptor protein involved in Fe transport
MQYDDMMEFSFGPWAEASFDDQGNTTNLYGLGFKSLNVGKTQISGLEVSLNGQGSITKDWKLNFIGGYTYMNSISLTPDLVYAILDRPVNLGGEDMDSITYNNNSSDPSVLKYRYTHIAKIDLELHYKKISVGGGFRYNDFMKNIDKIFTEDFVSIIIPGINEARENFTNGDFIVDVRGGYQLNDMLRFGIVINNLLNVEYMSRPADMRPPRTFAFQCNLKI